MRPDHSSRLSWLVLAALATLAPSAAAQRADAGHPASDRPVQVFILLGQSNMVGMGEVGGEEEGSLKQAIKTKKIYPYLLDDAGNWSERKDVRNVRVMAGGRRNRISM